MKADFLGLIFFFPWRWGWVRPKRGCQPLC
jgi:hypothetical protein